MRGITAGCNYLKMQRQISENNLDLMIISFLQNTISGIEAFSSLPWIARRLYFVSQMWDWFEWLEDLSTPSESFFSKFYFQPFLFFVSFLYTLIKNWAITLIIIMLLYYPLKYFIKRITSTYFQNLNKKFCSYWDDESLVEKIKGRGAVETVLRFSYNNISFIIVFPSLTAIFFLSSLRMEDIITLESVHIPFVSFSEIIDYNENLQPPIWMLLLMGVFFYLKSILKDSELLSLACSKEELELSKYDDNRKADLYYKISKFNSILAVVPFIYLTAKSDAFKKRPYYAIFINTSRRAIVFSIIFVYFSSFFLPRIIVLNFIILWFLNSLFHYKALTKFYNYIRFRNDNIALTIFYSEWKRYFIPIILCLVLICRNNLYNVPVAFTNYNINYIPFESINIKGSYYLVEKDGEKVKGWTADIKEVDSTHYYLYIYSDYPIQRYELEYCPSEYIINSEFLGTGIIEYKKEISKTIIKFSNKWVLEK